MKVYVCDTNNHCIRKVYYDIGMISTPEIHGIPAADDLMERDARITMSAQKRQGAKDGDLATNLVCEDGKCYVKK